MALEREDAFECLRDALTMVLGYSRGSASLLGIAFALRTCAPSAGPGSQSSPPSSSPPAVAGYEAIDRLINPQHVNHLAALAAAGAIGFAGNWLAAIIRTRAGHRLDSPALIAGLGVRVNWWARMAYSRSSCH